MKIPTPRGSLSRNIFLFIVCISFFYPAFVMGTQNGKQIITLQAKETSLGQVLKQVEQQSHLRFIYSIDDIEINRIVTVNFNRVYLDEVLQNLFGKNGIKWQYREGMIALKRESDNEKGNIYGFPNYRITGRIVDTKGQPIPGATIQVKGFKKGTQTNNDGSFVLDDITPGAVLVITSIGFEKKEIVVNGEDNLMVSLNVSTGILDETVVVAYGTTTARRLIGNVSTVKADQIEKSPVSNPLLALQGRVPGIFVNQSTGYANGGMITLVQGVASLRQGTDPFYVVDGVPYPPQLLQTNQGSFLGATGVNKVSSGNPLNYINPSDIESITILKDADATAIYGSRAANGAILITTKKGKGGPLKIDINLQQGYSKLTRNMKVLNTNQYLEMRREAISNDGLTVSEYDYDINGFWDTTRNTNWQKELINKTAQYSNYSMSVSGGSSNVQYLFGGTFHKETSIFVGDFGLKKGSFHFSLNGVSSDQRFRSQITANYSVDNNKLSSSSGSLVNLAGVLAPTAPKLYNDDGSLNWMPNSSGTSTWMNPLAYTYNKYNAQANNLVSNMILEYTLVKGLAIKSSFGYNRLQNNDQVLNSLAAVKPEERSYTDRSSTFGFNTISSWIIEPQLTYNLSTQDHRLDFLLGSSIQQRSNEGNLFFASGFSSDLLLSDIHSAARVSSFNTDISEYKYFGVFGRVNYSFKNKYLLNINVRRDGSSRFGPANRYHNFASVGAGWVFSDENIIKDGFPALSFGKIRISYGITGNDQIGDYTFLDLYQVLGVSVPYRGNVSLVPKGIVNPYLQWESNRKGNIGLDLGFLKDRILFTVNGYINRSSNQLTNYSLPTFTGVSSILRNIPATVQNSGLEVILNGQIVSNKTFQWNSSFNLTIARNKLISYQNLETSSDRFRYAIGRSLTSSRYYHSLGVDPTTGLYIVADSKGNPTSHPDASNDANVIVDFTPRFYGGIGNTFSYKNFTLDVLFQFVKQKGISNTVGNYAGYFGFNQPVQVMDRWRKVGDHASHQKFTSSNFDVFDAQGNAQASDWVNTDASYIKLRNVSFSYRIPNSIKEKLKMKEGRLFIQGQNLLTITNYVGFDPETGPGYSLPPLRTIVGGVQITF